MTLQQYAQIILERLQGTLYEVMQDRHLAVHDETEEARVSWARHIPISEAERQTLLMVLRDLPKGTVYWVILEGQDLCGPFDEPEAAIRHEKALFRLHPGNRYRTVVRLPEGV